MESLYLLNPNKTVLNNNIFKERYDKVMSQLMVSVFQVDDRPYMYPVVKYDNTTKKDYRGLSRYTVIDYIDAYNGFMELNDYVMCVNVDSMSRWACRNRTWIHDGNKLKFHLMTYDEHLKICKKLNKDVMHESGLMYIRRMVNRKYGGDVLFGEYYPMYIVQADE